MVDRELPARARQVHLLAAVGLEQRGVVDQAVECARLRLNGAHHLLAFVGQRQIGLRDGPQSGLDDVPRLEPVGQ